MPTPRAPRPAPRAVRRPVLVTAAITGVALAAGLVGTVGLVSTVGVSPTSAESADIPVTLAMPNGAGRPDRAAPVVTPVRIGRLARGEGPAVPRALGTSIVQGDRVVEIDAGEVQVLGVSGTDTVVVTYSDGGPAVERVAPDGARTQVLDRAPYGVDLSGDGTQLVTTRPRGTRRTVVAVRDSTTGRLLARHTFGSSATVLDADDGRVVVGQTGPARTLSWEVGTDRVEKVSNRTGYAASISADRLAVFTAAVYDGGCTVLSRLSAPARTTWRSCTEAVWTISPDGRRLITSGILVDGPIGQVDVRTPRGRPVATYRADGGSLDVFGWEDPHTMLVTASDRRGRIALVRCDRGECERASEVVAP